MAIDQPIMRSNFSPLVAGGFLAVLLLQWCFSGDATQFQEVGIGDGTSSYYGNVGGAPIHGGTFETIVQVYEGWVSRGKKPVILWLGNSQLHGVNQFQDGDQNSPLLIHEAMGPKGYELLCFSIPNANLGE